VSTSILPVSAGTDQRENKEWNYPMWPFCLLHPRTAAVLWLTYAQQRRLWLTILDS